MISYLYGGIDVNGLSRSFRRVVSAYEVRTQSVTALVEAVEKNHTVYYGGRYRLAYGAIGKRFGEANFIEDRHRAALIHSLRTVSQTLAKPA